VQEEKKIEELRASLHKDLAIEDDKDLSAESRADHKVPVLLF
jgi:hypothetical protein